MDTETPRKPRAPRKAKTDAASEVTAELPNQAETPEASVTAVPGDAPEAASAEVGATAAVAEPTVQANARVQLNASLEIKDVETSHRQLLAALEQATALTVDISSVATMDTAGVQLLLAFQSEAAKRGVTVEYDGQSAAFTHALTTVGLLDAVRHVAARD